MNLPPVKFTTEELPVALLWPEMGKARDAFLQEIEQLRKKPEASSKADFDTAVLQAAKRHFDAGTLACAKIILQWRKDHGGGKAEAREWLESQLLILRSWFMRYYEQRSSGSSHLVPLAHDTVDFASHANSQIQITLALAESGYAGRELVHQDMTLWQRMRAFLKDGGTRVFWGVVIAVCTALVMILLSKCFGIDLRK